MWKKRNKKPQTPRDKSVPKSRPATVETRNWLELPRDVTVSILSRLGAVEILWSVQYVCVAWRHICKDPLMWRIIDMRNDGDMKDKTFDLHLMCRRAVDRSAGDLIDLSVECFGSDITDRCRGIKRLRFTYCDGITDEGLSEMASKLPLLEELEISLCDNLSSKSVEAVGSSCPSLTSFKLNREWVSRTFWFGCPDEVFDLDVDYDDYHVNAGQTGTLSPEDAEALAIAGTMHGLRHLQVFGNQLTFDGLKAILDSCPHLESLDLRRCYNLSLVETRCAERITNLRLPYDSTEDYEHCYEHYFDDSKDLGYEHYFHDSEDDPDEDYDYDESRYSSDDSDVKDQHQRVMFYLD